MTTILFFLAAEPPSKLPEDWPWVVLGAVLFTATLIGMLMWMARREARRHAAEAESEEKRSA